VPGGRDDPPGLAGAPGVGGEELSAELAKGLRDRPVQPHQCRCIVYEPDNPENANRCAMLVLTGPDSPVCSDCEAKHWTPGMMNPALRARLAGLGNGPNGSGELGHDPAGSAG